MTGYELAGIIVGLAALFFSLRTPAAFESYTKAFALSAENVEKLEKKLKAERQECDKKIAELTMRVNTLSEELQKITRPKIKKTKKK